MPPANRMAAVLVVFLTLTPSQTEQLTALGFSGFFFLVASSLCFLVLLFFLAFFSACMSSRFETSSSLLFPKQIRMNGQTDESSQFTTVLENWKRWVRKEGRDETFTFLGRTGNGKERKKERERWE